MGHEFPILAQMDPANPNAALGFCCHDRKCCLECLSHHRDVGLELDDHRDMQSGCSLQRAPLTQ